MKLDVDRVKEIIGLGLGKAFIPIFDEIAKTLTANSGAIRKWADDTGKSLADVARDFIDLFKGGNSGPGEAPIFRTQFVQDFVSAKDQVVSAITLIKNAFTGLMDVLDRIAKTINSVF